MAIIIGTKDNFKTEVLEAKGTVIVDFCYFCESVLPLLPIFWDEVVSEDANKKSCKSKI